MMMEKLLLVVPLPQGVTKGGGFVLIWLAGLSEGTWKVICVSS